MSMNLPDKIKIIDTVYAIEYVEKPSDVDIFRRESLWGQIDYWTRTIRVYRNVRCESDIWQTLWHEIIHAICEKLHIATTDGKLNDNETVIDLLATAINAVLLDNDWLRKWHEQEAEGGNTNLPSSYG